MKFWLKACFCFSCCRVSEPRVQPDQTAAKRNVLHRGSTTAPSATFLLSPQVLPEPKSASIPNRPLTEYVFPRRRHARTLSSEPDNSS